MSDVWLNQDTLFNCENSKSFAKHICKQVEQRLKDQFTQQWSKNLSNHSSCDMYRNYKINFELEKYLTVKQ